MMALRHHAKAKVPLLVLQSRATRTEHKQPSSPEMQMIKIKNKIPHPGLGPQNTKKKTRKIRRWSENEHFRLFLSLFRIRDPT